jgi:hypothetical protein
MGNRRQLRQPRDRFTACHEASTWIRAHLDQVQAAHRAGRVLLCDHLAAGGRAPGSTALWAGWIVCGLPECRGRLLPTGVEDRRCDRCGEIVDPIHPDIVWPHPTLAVWLRLLPVPAVGDRSAVRRRTGRNEAMNVDPENEE